MSQTDMVKADWQRDPAEGWKSLAERMEAVARSMECAIADLVAANCDTVIRIADVRRLRDERRASDAKIKRAEYGA